MSVAAEQLSCKKQGLRFAVTSSASSAAEASSDDHLKRCRDEGHCSSAVIPFTTMGEKRRKFVPIVEVDEDWQPLFMIEDDDELRACPGKLGGLYAREFLNRTTLFHLWT